MKRKIKKYLKKVTPDFIRNIIRYKKPQEKYIYELHIADVERLKGKAIIVTGGGGSIGSAMCYRLAIEGANIGVAGRNIETINETISQIVEAGVPANNLMPLVLDVTKMESIKTAIDSFVDRYKKLDVFINNAGGSARGKIHPLEEQEFTVVEEIINLNLLGTMRCCQQAIRHMRKAGGKIINFGSTIGSNGQKYYSEYSAAKSGIIGLTKSLALELGEYGITVNMITPGWVWRNSFDGNQLRKTDKNALKRYGYPEEVASLVAYLCTDAASYITGNDFKVDGGRTLGLMKE